MSEDPGTLQTEAERILRVSKRALEAGRKTVHDISVRREKARGIVAESEEERDRARKKADRAFDEEVSREEYKELRMEYERASWRASRARELLGSEAVDHEYQKAVARQVGGLVREDATQKFEAIAARTDDSQLKKTVAKYQDELSRDAYRLITEFSPARELQLDEVRKAKANAQRIIDGHPATDLDDDP